MNDNISAAAMRRLREEQNESRIEEEITRKRDLIQSYGDDKTTHGAVITFVRNINGREFTYAAIKIETRPGYSGFWYVSGKYATVPMRWRDLTLWLAEGDCPGITHMIPSF